MAEPTIQIGGGNWAGKSDNLLGYYKEGERFYKQDLTFSRTTTGTYTDKDGYIQEMPPNLITYSQDFSNSNYTKDSGVTIGSTNNVSPIGDYTATQINVTDSGRIYQNVTSAEYRTSVYLKAGTFAYFKVVGQNVDLNLGTITSTYPNKIENIGNGWYRISISYIQTIRPFQIQAFPDNTYTTHTTSGNYFVWGAMLNYGDTTKTYFPTTTRLNIPRVDYLNNSNGSLILEPQRTNLITHSSDFTEWSTIGSPTLTSNYGESPDGLNNSTRVQFSSGDRIYKSASASGDISYSVYLKGTGTVRMRDNSGAYVNDVTLTNEWVRYDYTFNASISNVQLQQTSGTSDFEIWGAQVESGSYATTLINTSGSSVTRNADACSITNVADRIGQTEGTVFLETKLPQEIPSSSGYFSISDGTANNSYIVQFRNNGTLRIYQNGLDGSNLAFVDSNINLSQNNKIAFKYEQLSSSMALYINGVEISLQGSFVYENTTGINSIKMAYVNGSLNLYSEIKDMKIYNTALTNSELATLTT